MVLNRLKEKGLKMGVVTNSLRADLEKVLSRLGLKDFFDVEVSVDVAGEAKPAEGIFTYAVEKLGLQPKEVLFVGNEVKVDYEGAEKAGLRALVIDRENRLKQGVKKIKDLRGILPVMSTEEK
jgi:putative hydrolase of the HAD superfamily